MMNAGHKSFELQVYSCGSCFIIILHSYFLVLLLILFLPLSYFPSLSLSFSFIPLFHTFLPFLCPVGKGISFYSIVSISFFPFSPPSNKGHVLIKPGIISFSLYFPDSMIVALWLFILVLYCGHTHITNIRGSVKVYTAYMHTRTSVYV